MVGFYTHLPVHTPAKTDRTHGLLRTTAIWPGNARDRHGHLCCRMGARASRHGVGHFFAHGTMLRNQVRRHPQHLGFRQIGIGHEPAL